MRELTKIPEQLREDVACCAHAVWCHRMIDQGWSPGPTIDPETKQHSALRPFEELSPFLRDLIADWIDSAEVATDFFRSVEDALDDDELPASGIEVGAMVRMSRPDPTQPIDPDEDYVGRVVECVVRRPEYDRLDCIKVAWPDGEIVEYPPNELEIVRAQG